MLSMNQFCRLLDWWHLYIYMIDSRSSFKSCFVD
jgi:hypothetical protein